MQNRLDAALAQNKKLLSIFLTAGYPKLTDTVPLLEALQESGVDLIEIGFPFSDPLADGPVIQHSNEVAIKNGMTVETLFKQLEGVRKKVEIPLLLMGYINPVLQYGIERFCADCKSAGIDGVILPDLPVAEFLEEYREIFHSHGLHQIFLVTPSTPDQRIRMLDECSTGFIYAVSSAAVTGGTVAMSGAREEYFKKLEKLSLKHPVMVGFGISDKPTFNSAAAHTKGAIIGSAFIKAIGAAADPIKAAKQFVQSIR